MERFNVEPNCQPQFVPIRDKTVEVATAARLNTNPSTNRQVQSKAGPQLTATWPSLLLYWRASWYSQGFRV